MSGDGWKQYFDRLADELMSAFVLEEERCPTCGGTGRVPDRYCDNSSHDDYGRKGCKECQITWQ